ncbi:hypothetical protein [Streptomyces sp. NPDC058953]
MIVGLPLRNVVDLKVVDYWILKVPVPPVENREVGVHHQERV